MKELIDVVGGPTIVIFIGGLIAGLGAIWAAIDQNKTSQQLASKNEEIARLSLKIADSITGGSNVCFFSLVRDQPEKIGIINWGENPLYDITARIVNLDDFSKKLKQGITSENVTTGDVFLNIGNMAPHASQIINSPIPLSADTIKLNIFFTARNGFFTQELRIKKIGGGRTVATRVTWTPTTDKIPKVAFEKINEDYPRNPDGSVSWE